MSSQIKSATLPFYITPAQNCPYLPEKQSRTLFLSPEVLADSSLHSALVRRGFRRSGQHIYRPECETCNDCISVRIPVERFTPNRNQTRCQKKARIFSVRTHPAIFTQHHYQLFERYINARHSDGDMYPVSSHQYQKFLLTNWLESEYLEFFDIKQRKLIATCVYDKVSDGLSAVYTFFDPDYSKYSPGKLAILNLIQLARQQSLAYVYLGYWIKKCKKMAYKSEYRPIECFINNNWVNLR